MKYFLKPETPEETKKRLFELSDKGDYGLCPPVMDAQTALDELCHFFLGEDWYIVTPMHTTQVNYEIVYEIERNFRRFKR